MVQGILLTEHPGSVHGGGEAPGGQSSLRQGAGKGPDGAPDLGSSGAAEHKRDCEIGFCLRKFPMVENKKAKGAARGATRGPGAPLAASGGRLGTWWWSPGP